MTSVIEIEMTFPARWATKLSKLNIHTWGDEWRPKHNPAQEHVLFCTLRHVLVALAAVLGKITAAAKQTTTRNTFIKATVAHSVDHCWDGAVEEQILVALSV